MMREPNVESEIEDAELLEPGTVAPASAPARSVPPPLPSPVRPPPLPAMFAAGSSPSSTPPGAAERTSQPPSPGASSTPSPRVGGFSSRPPLAPPRPSGNPSVAPRPSRMPLPGGDPAASGRFSGVPQATDAAIASPGGSKVDPTESGATIDLRRALDEAKHALLVKEAETRVLITQRDARIAEAEAARARAAEATRGLAEVLTLTQKLAESEAKVKELKSSLEARDAKVLELEEQLKSAHTGSGGPEDDLKKIRGIGPAFERELRRLGVRTYAQIAAWTATDIDTIAPKIKARPDRIRRDGWVTSAERLVEGR
jgi:predicted flap endonuclease-1-like 5' DNA nuclease